MCNDRKQDINIRAKYPDWIIKVHSLYNISKFALFNISDSRQYELRRIGKWIKRYKIRIFDSSFYCIDLYTDTSRSRMLKIYSISSSTKLREITQDVAPRQLSQYWTRPGTIDFIQTSYLKQSYKLIVYWTPHPPGR